MLVDKIERFNTKIYKYRAELENFWSWDKKKQEESIKLIQQYLAMSSTVITQQHIKLTCGEKKQIKLYF